MSNVVNDWQISCKTLTARGTHLLHTGQWTDCTFLIGREPNQTIIKVHKLILAMASPVFETMFYGGIPEGNDPILIPDVLPDAFKALLEYIYSDKINISTFDKACELCYAAKKYMLPHLVQECTKYLWSDLNPKNACRAYEFAKLFEEPNLMEKCLQIISSQTLDVLSESTFEEIELETMIKIFELDTLNISSELDLFHAALRYVNAQINNQNASATQNTLKQNNKSDAASDSEATQSAGSNMQVGENREASVFEKEDSPPAAIPSTSTSKTAIPNTDNSSIALSIRNAIKHIRFLTLTPKQFAEGPAKSNLLSQNEAFAILMNISSSRSDLPMPEGFTTMTHPRIKVPPQCMDICDLNYHDILPVDIFSQSRNRTDRKYYCQRSIIHEIDCLNTSDLECSVTFTVDKNISVIGVQIPTQVLGENPSVPSAVYYSELLYAHLLDADGSRLTYTHYTSRVSYGALLDITFNRPFYIQRNKVYKVAVVFNKLGWYPIGGSCTERVNVNGTCFSFGVGPTSDSVRDGLIRSIIFEY